MKIVKVQYTTTAAYAAVNRNNIKRVVDALQALKHPGIKYSAYILPDGKTFVHFDEFDNEDAHLVLQSLDAFKQFDEQLWASGLESAPVMELPVLVASTE